MSESNEHIDLARALHLAVLNPVDIETDTTRMMCRQLPAWWTDEVGLLSGQQVELTSPVLLEFLSTARSIWLGGVDASANSMLFEVRSPQGQDVQLQALAVRQEGKCFFVVRNLCAIDDLVSSVLRTARVNLVQQSKERSSHRKEVATIAADRDEAKRLEAAKSSFLANMSHEIRTPLTTILGMASMAQKSSGIQQEEYIEAVVNAANRLLRLSNDILDLSRIQAEKLELDQVVFSLHDLMMEFEKIWRLHAAKKDLRFEVNLDPGTANYVLGDPFRLQQVLTNLVNNAIKFTETGDVSLGITPSNEDEHKIQFSIQDTGVGISTEQCDRIFETFTQVDESPTRRHQGAGLGLAIAANLVRLMGSDIQVESELGKGSRFFFDANLPLSSADESVLESPLLVNDSNGSLRVLVAEDHALNRSIIVETLQSEGIETFEAENGEFAMAAWREHPFDVVLMDCQMPVMSGLEAISLIRQEEGDKRTPIIALTAHAMKEEKQRLLDSGADHYMPKPFERDDLIALIYELAGK